MIRIELEINRPQAEVFDYLADFKNENEWNKIGSDIVQLTDEPLGVGARFRGEYERMGTMEYEIKEYSRPAHLGVEGKARMFTWYIASDFSNAGGRTRMVVTMDPRPKGILGLAKPLIEKIMTRQMHTNMGNFKAALERDS